LGYLGSLNDLKPFPSPRKNGTAVKIPDLGTSPSSDIREGVAEGRAKGKTSRASSSWRDGMNAAKCHQRREKKLAETKSSLPPGVEVVSGYDRSGLIHASIETLQRDLLEEAVIVSVVHHYLPLPFSLGADSDLTLPIAVLAAFIPMYYLHVSSNIMSLGGLALASAFSWTRPSSWSRTAIDDLRTSKRKRSLSEPERRRVLWTRRNRLPGDLFLHCSSSSCRFLPVFLLRSHRKAMFGRWLGRNLAVGFSSLLAITLVPVLMVIFIRGACARNRGIRCPP